jgi:aspartate aminotransferase-like enzyme
MATNTQRPYRLRLPGPTEVPERVLQATAKPVLNHRGPEFAQQLGEVADLLRPVMGTKNEIMVFASSGTGVMEASVANALVPGEKILILNNGQWGGRFKSIAAALGMGAGIDEIEVPWGEAIPADVLKARLSKGDYAAVIAIHNESSTGAVGDLREIGAIVAATDAIFIVDSVSGLGGIEMRQDEWGVDILVSASQKALMCPPGLGLVSVSAKAWKRIEPERGQARFYWDFRKALEWAVKGQTAFTPPVSLIAGLHEALTAIHEEGIENVLQRHHVLAEALKAGTASLGLPMFPTSPLTSNTVGVFKVPAAIDGTAIVKKMYDEHGSVIAGARNSFRGKMIRIGTMGMVSAEHILTDLDHLGQVLVDLGADVDASAGVAAARGML